MRQGKAEAKPDITPEQIEDLTEAVITLSEQVRVLRQAVVEIEDELGWAIRNRVVCVEPIEQTARRITSFPLDSLADDFHERVNAFSPSDIPTDDATTPTTISLPRKQSHLW